MEKLTIVITTYNLEEYIEQAVRSILMQKVDFEYKIRISDDCSTDRTINIIDKLQKQYPDKIEILLSEVNRGSLKNSNKAFSGVTSQYIAFLDGDDFWIGDEFLQKKIDFLDRHPEFTMCGGDTEIFYSSDGSKEKVINSSEDCIYDFQDYLTGKMPYVHTSSIVLRNCIYQDGLPQTYYDVEDTFENCAVRGEEFRFMTHFERGKLKVYADVMSCYRIHERGIWQGSSLTKRFIETAIARNFFDKYYANIESDFFRRTCLSAYRDLMRNLVDRQIYNNYFLTEEETWLVTEYLKDIAKRKLVWKDNEIRYILQKQEPEVDIIRRIWRRFRKCFVH